MEINTRRTRDVLIIEMVGKLDAPSARDAEAGLSNLITNEDRRVVLNFGKLAYLNSLGMRLILKTAAELNANRGELKICNANSVIMNLFKITGVQGEIKIYETEAEAFSAFSG